MSHIYLLLRDEKVVYVGQTSQEPSARVNQHKNLKEIEFDTYTFIECDSEEVLDIEKKIIGKFKPIYNNPIDRYPELKLASVSKSFRSAREYGKAITYITTNNIRHFIFNKTYYIEKTNINKIKELFKVAAFITPDKIIGSIIDDKNVKVEMKGKKIIISKEG